MVLNLSGEAHVFADRSTVWDALHDASCLKLCVPGCRSIERVSPTRFDLSVRVGLGPIGIVVAGMVRIEESDPRHVLCLNAMGSGGLAGLAAGRLRMTLADAAAGCRIGYDAEVEPQGAFAALGSDVLSYQARRLVERFVATFAATVGTPRIGTPQMMRRPCRPALRPGRPRS